MGGASMSYSVNGPSLRGGPEILDSMPTSVATTTTPRWRGEVVAWYPHDMWAFSQGLVLHQGELYESTGFEGISSLRRVHLETGLVLQSIRLGRSDFGEGIALSGNRIVQLTFTQQSARIHELPSFDRVGEFTYEGQGWGLAFDGTSFVMSNGSSELTLRDPVTFDVRSRIAVTLEGQPQRLLNELECVGDLIYANVFRTDCILEFGRDGLVCKVIDLSDLLKPNERCCLGLGDPLWQRAAVLNGIAYDPSDGTFLVTGKLWPKIFRVRFVP
jgi:glutaminyl-peptide cyclotransferase